MRSRRRRWASRNVAPQQVDGSPVSPLRADVGATRSTLQGVARVLVLVEAGAWSRALGCGRPGAWQGAWPSDGIAPNRQTSEPPIKTKTSPTLIPTDALVRRETDMPRGERDDPDRRAQTARPDARGTTLLNLLEDEDLLDVSGLW